MPAVMAPQLGRRERGVAGGWRAPADGGLCGGDSIGANVDPTQKFIATTEIVSESDGFLSPPIHGQIRVARTKGSACV